MPDRVLLLTGFEPFGGDSCNPSADVAQSLNGSRLGGCLVRSALLPVDCLTMPDHVRRLIEECGPGLAGVVHVGLANGRAVIGLERVAINCMDFPMPDNAGHQPLGEPCVPGGPAAYFSTLPLRHALAALRAAGVPAAISNTAGTYLCNQTMYTTLHFLASTGCELPAGFVHVPYLSEQVAQRGENLPSLAFPVMKTAVALVLEQTATVAPGAPVPPIVAGAVS